MGYATAKESSDWVMAGHWRSQCYICGRFRGLMSESLKRDIETCEASQGENWWAAGYDSKKHAVGHFMHQAVRRWPKALAVVKAVMEMEPRFITEDVQDALRAFEEDS